MDRNTLLAFFLIAIVLIFTPYYMGLVDPLPEAPALETRQDTTQQKTAASAETKTTKTPVTGESIVAGFYKEEKTLTLRTDLYEAVISSRGGGSFKSFVFNNYFTKDSNRVEQIGRASCRERV